MARGHQAHVQQVVDPAGIPGLAGEASYQLLEMWSVLADGLLAFGRDGPDELLENAPRLWPETTTLPFHYKHPVTGKEFVPDTWGSFPDA